MPSTSKIPLKSRKERSLPTDPTCIATRTRSKSRSTPKVTFDIPGDQDSNKNQDENPLTQPESESEVPTSESENEISASNKPILKSKDDFSTDDQTTEPESETDKISPPVYDPRRSGLRQELTDIETESDKPSETSDSEQEQQIKVEVTEISQISNDSSSKNETLQSNTDTYLKEKERGSILEKWTLSTRV